MKPFRRAGRRFAKQNGSSSIGMPLKIVHRHKGKQEAYIMGGGKYVASMTKTNSPKYIEHISELVDCINKGEIDTISAARLWLKQRWAS